MAEHAGPALDVEVHTRVFAAEITCSEGVNCADIPPYSTDLTAAWLVVEHFALQHIPVSLYSMSHGVWWCFFGMVPIFDPSAPLKPTHEARANTAPEVICLAAIRALAPDRAR